MRGKRRDGVVGYAPAVEAAEGVGGGDDGVEGHVEVVHRACFDGDVLQGLFGDESWEDLIPCGDQLGRDVEEDEFDRHP